MNIVEGPATRILYRGDSNPVDRYELEKTYDHALFGQGIYLTDNKEVAGDYTINKGAADQMISSRETFETQKDAIADVIQQIINNDLGWPETYRKTLDEFKQMFWQMSFDDPEKEAKSEAVREKYKETALANYRKVLAQAKRIFKERARNYRIVKDTMGNWTVVVADRPGQVSRFEIPESYLERTIHGDRPLDDHSLGVIRDYIFSVTDNGRSDWRVRDNTNVRDFDEWLKIFKAHGADYAWRDGQDRLIGGHGGNPSLDEIWNGQHGGFHIFYKNIQKFIQYMMSHGFVGIEYDGGKRIGEHVRGGGGIRHQSFVLWDADYVTHCRVDSERVVDPEVDSALLGSLRGQKMLNRHRVPK